MRILVLFVLLSLPVFVIAQRHLELQSTYGNDFAAIKAQIIAEYEQGLITDRDLKFFKRWELAVSPYLDGDGRIQNNTARTWQALRKYTQLQSTLPDPQYRVTHGEWEDLTPGDFSPPHPASGRINCIAVHPTNANTIFVGSPVGGLWVTYNGGTSWTNLTDGFINLGVSGIVIHPTTPNIMYMLTGDGDGRDAPSMGVFKSYNGGYDWHPTSLQWDRSDVIYGYKLMMKPDDPDIMFAVTTSGLYYTDDGWNTHDDDYSLNFSLRDMEFVPGHPDTFYVTGQSKVWKAWIDGAASYFDVDSDILNNNDIGLSQENWNRLAVAVTPDDPDRVYVLFGKNAPSQMGTYELYMSDDNAQSFSLQSIDSTGIASSQCSYNMTLAVVPGDPDHVLLGTVSIWESTNAGASFTKIANGTGLPSVHADIHALTYHGPTLYVGSDGGISKSTNNGASFTNITDGLKIMQFTEIDVLGTQIMGGTQDNGTNTWNIGDAVGDHIWGGDGFECMFDPSDPNVLYYCDQNQRIREDVGVGVFLINPPGHTTPWDASWTMHPTNFDTLYCAFRDIGVSYDRGSTWTITDPNFTPVGSQTETIRAITQGVNNPNYMYCSDRFEVRRTTNIHATTPSWTDVTGNLPISGVEIGGMVVDPDNVNRIWVTLRGYNDGDKVFVSITGGGSWTNISGSLPNVPVHCIAYHPGSSNGIYVGTDIGVYYRNDNMSDWIWFANGFPKSRILDLRATGSYIYAGTYGRGMWRSEHYTTCPIAISLTPSTDPSPPHTTGIQVYSASSSVLSTRVITGGIGTDVTYQAGNYVQLNPGFHAEINNLFLARINGCPE